MSGASVALADLSVPEGPLQSMLSGLGFQQGLLKAATAVAAQEQCSRVLNLKVAGVHLSSHEVCRT